MSKERYRKHTTNRPVDPLRHHNNRVPKRPRGHIDSAAKNVFASAHKNKRDKPYVPISYIVFKGLICICLAVTIFEIIVALFGIHIAPLDRLFRLTKAIDASILKTAPFATIISGIYLAFISKNIRPDLDPIFGVVYKKVLHTFHLLLYSIFPMLFLIPASLISNQLDSPKEETVYQQINADEIMPDDDNRKKTKKPSA